MATPPTMEPEQGTIRNLQQGETSQGKAALIILLRGELASLSLQNKRKRALESHREVNKKFLSPASFRRSWEGALSCLSPKGRAPQGQRKQARGSGLSFWDLSLLETPWVFCKSCERHSPAPMKLFSLGWMVVYAQPDRCRWVWAKTHSLMVWSCCFTSLQGLCFGFDLQLTGNGKGRLKLDNLPPHCWAPLQEQSSPPSPLLSPAL